MGAMYGRMNTKIEEAHSRIDKAEAERMRRDTVIDQKLDGIANMLTGMRVMMAKLGHNDHTHEEE